MNSYYCYNELLLLLELNLITAENELLLLLQLTIIIATINYYYCYN